MEKNKLLQFSSLGTDKSRAMLWAALSVLTGLTIIFKLVCHSAVQVPLIL